MKYIKKYNESLSSEDIFDIMDHQFLKKDLIVTIFSDLVDEGYTLGFKGHYDRPGVFSNGYSRISDSEIVKDKYKLKSFNIKFYKDLGSNEFRDISEIKNELEIVENSIFHYLDCNEFDDDYKLDGMKFSVEGDPHFRNLQAISLLFKNNSI